MFKQLKTHKNAVLTQNVHSLKVKLLKANYHKIDVWNIEFVIIIPFSPLLRLTTLVLLIVLMFYTQIVEIFHSHCIILSINFCVFNGHAKSDVLIYPANHLISLTMVNEQRPIPNALNEKPKDFKSLIASFFLFHYILTWERQLIFSSFCFILSYAVRRCRPGKSVQMSEQEVRGLCLKSREIFLQQPILLELEAPLSICGKI